MGIDLNTSRSNKPKRCKLYKRVYQDKGGNTTTTKNAKLIPNTASYGIFYATDKDTFITQTISMGNIKKTQTVGTIITEDRVDNIEVDDFVEYAGSTYIVDNIIIADSNTNKEFSSRPTQVTEIRLRK
jgi:hypothetical protein